MAGPDEWSPPPQGGTEFGLWPALSFFADVGTLSAAVHGAAQLAGSYLDWVSGRVALRYRADGGMGYATQCVGPRKKKFDGYSLGLF